MAFDFFFAGEEVLMVACSLLVMSDKGVGAVIVGALVTELETGFGSCDVPTILEKGD